MHPKKPFPAVVLAMALVGMQTLACHGQGIVDQSFTPPVATLDSQIGGGIAEAQTFTPQISGRLEGFDFWIEAIGLGSAPLKSELEVEVATTTSAGQPSGILLGTAILQPSFMDEQPGNYKHIAMDTFNNNIQLKAGERYAAVFQTVPSDSTGATYDFPGYSASQLGGSYSYDGGQGMFSQDGRSWQAYGSPDFDYAFRTYMIVPEPSTGELLMCAGVLLSLQAKRRLR